MRKQEIYFHKDQKECDFVIRKNNRIIQAIQVTTSLSDEQTKSREIDGLIEALEKYGLKEGTIITENEQSSLKVREFKIRILPIWKWLLDLENPRSNC
jgi:hypothetical protein